MRLPVTAHNSPCLAPQMRAVGPDARAADVKQCFALREALGLLDFADPSITDTKRLMLLATFHPQVCACKPVGWEGGWEGGLALRDGGW